MSGNLIGAIQGLFSSVTGALVGVVNEAGREQTIPTYLLDPNGNPTGLPVVNRKLNSGTANTPYHGTGNGITANSTFSHVFSAIAPFSAVKLVFLNSSTSTAVVDDTVVGSAPTIYPSGSQNIAYPVGAVWGSPIGSITIPVGVSVTSPGMFVTPSIPIRSQTRFPAVDGDGGTYPLLLVRNFINTGNTNAAYSRPASATFGTSYNSTNNDGISLAAKAFVGAGNFVTSNIAGQSTGTGDVNPFFTTMGVIFQYDQLVTSVCSIGDSIMAGSGDNLSQCTPFTWQAIMNLRALGKSVTHYNCGVPSGGMLDFIYNANNVINNIKPDIIVLPAYTINSAHVTQADYDLQWQQVMGIAAQATAAGIKVIMQTCYPHNGDSAGEFAIKLNQDQRVRNSGFPFIDFSSMYGVNGAFLNPAWCVGDNVHPSVLGNQYMASLSQPVLASVCL
ncbi:hypothetical protein AAKU67_002215 [Oxalobacteraceae bacterium GrIS 2.11]